MSLRGRDETRITGREAAYLNMAFELTAQEIACEVD